MTSVMVTGATTPIGEELVAALLSRTDVDQVLAVGYEPDALPCSRDLLHGRLHYLAVDLTRSREVQRLMFGAARDLGIEVVIHNAVHRSPTAVGRNAHALNVGALDELLRAAARHPTIRRFVFRSCAEVYEINGGGCAMISEEHGLNLSPLAPQWIRDRVEADLLAVGHMGRSRLQVIVLRSAECLAPGTGSQLYDYLVAPVCFRPIGFDPMINVISREDLSRAILAACDYDGSGIFNIPGKEVLPLSDAIFHANKPDIAVPNLLLDRMYRLRARVLGTEFRYDLNSGRFHLGGTLDGRRARDVLHYEPAVPAAWPTEQVSQLSNRRNARPITGKTQLIHS